MNQPAELSLESVIVRASSVVDAEVDGEVVAMSVVKGTLYGLDPIASRIWNMIAVPTRLGDLCTNLVAEYDVDAETCARDVLALLRDLHREGVIETAPAAAGD